jgi:hypothetical protein
MDLFDSPLPAQAVSRSRFLKENSIELANINQHVHIDSDE